MKRTFKPEDLLEFTYISNPKISPSKKYVAYTWARADVESDSYKSKVRIRNLESGELTVESRGPHDYSPSWDLRGERIAYISRGDKEEYSIRVLKLNGSTLEVLTCNSKIINVEWSPKRIIGFIKEEKVREDSGPIRSTKTPIWFDGRGLVHNLVRTLNVADPETGYYERVMSKDLDVISYSFSRDGKKTVVVASRVNVPLYNPVLVRILVVDLETGELYDPLGRDVVTDHAEWSVDGKHVVFTGHFMERGFSTHRRLYMLNVESGELTCLTKSLNYNLDRRVYHDVRSPYSKPPNPVCSKKHVYFVASVRGSTNLYRTSLEGIVEPIVEGEFSVEEFDVKDDRIVYVKVSDCEPAELWVKSRSGEYRLTRYNQHILENFEIVKPEKYVYKTSDGSEVEGWILKPVNYSPENKYPAILNIHGGPKSKFGYAFMFEHQLYASQGYVVLYFNPRGSDGYSEEFADIRCKYGERDYQDIVEGVDYALEKYGFIDSRRLGVTGISYGGFMTNWIVTKSKKFKTAISQNGISDWIAEFGTTDIGYYFVPDQICGDPVENRERLIRKSPLYHADKVETPILLLHSMDDYRCYLDQALKFFTTLKSLGKEAELVLFREGGHVFGWTGKPSSRIGRLKVMLEWFNKHLKQC